MIAALVEEGNSQMALTAVRGYYRDGHIELEEYPELIREAEVVVTFLTFRESNSAQRAQLRQRFLQRMEQGYPLGGKGYTRREELYAERFDVGDSG